MDPGGISVARTLPIDGALLDDVLLRLRRDATTSALRWTLGDRGTAEVEIAFTSTGTVACSSWTTRARLWSSSGLAVTAATVRLIAAGPDHVEVVLEPSFTPGAASDDEAAAALVDLARGPRRALRGAALARDSERDSHPVADSDAPRPKASPRNLGFIVS